MIGKFFDMKLSDQPYTSSEAHLLDLARLCDLRIDLYYDVFIDNYLLLGRKPTSVSNLQKPTRRRKLLRPVVM
jgi:hypothetical protein